MSIYLFLRFCQDQVFFERYYSFVILCAKRKMGVGFSTTLGKDSLAEENKQFLESLLQRLSGMDYHSEHLDLSNRCLRDEGVRAGCRALKFNRQIHSLDLGSNGITHECVEYLLEAITENNSITSLCLSGNTGLGDTACKYLGEFLATNPPLEELSLFHCDITDEGVEELVNGLMYNTNLAVLRLDMNKLTEGSLEMFLQLVTSCENKTLGHVTLSGNPGPFDEVSLLALRRVTQQGRESLIEKHEAIAAALAEADQREREEESRRLQEEEELEAARREAELEEEALAAAAKEEDELLHKQQMENERRRAAGMSTNNSAYAAELRRQKEDQQRAKVIDTAYQWRDKLTRNGALIREWRDGFTVMQTKPGDAPGTVPSVIAEAPRRLKACWCDPHDVSAPYAKTLHYHCKFEAQSRSLNDEADVASPSKYSGCHASGHCCASVGFFAKPLPDTSAAHFFASAHPAATV